MEYSRGVNASKGLLLYSCFNKAEYFIFTKISPQIFANKSHGGIYSLAAYML
jgi:hypothetical protein